MGTFVYTNTFDPDGDGDNLNGATQTDTSGPNTGNVGVVNSASSGDPDNEFVIFDDGNKTRLELNADLTGDERVNQFAASMSVDFVTNPGPWGDGEPDGITFNLGDPSTMQSPEEKGVSEGLSIRLAPFNWGVSGYPGNVIDIRWNGVSIGSTTVADMSTGGAVDFDVSVDEFGNVTVTLGDDTATGTIPGGEWATTSQDGWDFVLAGRTGGNQGEAIIDDVDVNANVVCFADGTLIETPNGPVQIEKLRAGDVVSTLDHGTQTIRWINARTISTQELERNEKLRPIVIHAGALGVGYPKTDLRVSRQHRVLVRSKIAERMFGSAEILVPAIKLIDLPGVDVDERAERVTYLHFLCDAHEIVFANGLPSETLLVAEEARKSLGQEALTEIFTIFPELKDAPELSSTARLVPTARRLRNFVIRHIKNMKPLVEAV